MEPTIWAWLVGTVLSGIVVNRADAGLAKACSVGWQQAIQNLDAPALKQINELSVAVHCAFLWAQQSLVQECLDEFTGGTYGGLSGHTTLPGYEEAVSWLISQDKQLKADLKSLEQGKLATLTEADIPALEGLLQSQDAAGQLNQQLTGVLHQKDVPASYVNRAAAVETGLLARLAAFFEFELKTNQTVQNWFQTELLLRINSQLQTTPLMLQDLEDGLRGLASQLPEVLSRLDNLVLTVNELGHNVAEVRVLVTARADQLVALVLNNADDLAVLKRLMGEILTAWRQQMMPASVVSAVKVTKPREGSNPSICGPAVSPKSFFGRRHTRAHVKNRIGAVEPQSVNIVGLRRNGKSSMLQYLQERTGEFCTPEQQPLVVLLDLQDRRFHTPGGILEGLRRGIRKQTGSEPWLKEANDDPFELEEGLESLRNQGYRLIVMFDEFGAIGKRLEQFQDWGDDWRAKASASLVTLVIASRRPLSEVYSTIGLTSPFGNIFSTTVLGALELEPWQQLLAQGSLLKTEIDWVNKTAGKLPYYAQLAASTVWQHGISELAQQEFRQQAQRRFEELWIELTPIERTTLQQLAKGERSLALPAVIKKLQRHGLLCSEAKLCSYEFTAFVGEQR